MEITSGEDETAGYVTNKGKLGFLPVSGKNISSTYLLHLVLHFCFFLGQPTHANTSRKANEGRAH